jgi:DedD protein
MGLFSDSKRNPDAAAPAGLNEPGDAVQQARTRARRRLIGAVVLLVIGVIGFPLVFETRPRPVPVDIPIEIPRQDNAPALVMPPRPAPTKATPPTAAVPTPASADVITEPRAEAAGRDTAAGASDPAKTAAVSSAASKPTARSAVAAESPNKSPAGTPTPTTDARSTSPTVANATPSSKPATPSTASTADGARAKALLESKATAAADGARFVVQVGAFSEADSARETRAKAEKLGLKTYTQVAQTPSGNRIRVRIGPFANRAEADAALAKARAGGLNAVVLTL